MRRKCNKDFEIYYVIYLEWLFRWILTIFIQQKVAFVVLHTQRTHMSEAREFLSQANKIDQKKRSFRARFLFVYKECSRSKLIDSLESKNTSNRVLRSKSFESKYLGTHILFQSREILFQKEFSFFANVLSL